MNSNNSLTVWNTRFSPLDELRREVDQLFKEFSLVRPAAQPEARADEDWCPACDVEEERDHFLLTFDVPGAHKDQMKLEVVGNRVSLSGERRQTMRGRADSLRYGERRQGRFQRSITLPVAVDGQDVEAHYQDGILQVYVPKAESAKPREIKIADGSGRSFLGRLIGRSGDDQKDKAVS